jgi:hypothetical protein
LPLSAEVVALKPGYYVIQRSLPSWTARVTERRPELIPKALRDGGMSAAVIVGVGKEDFDPPLCFR